MGPGCVWLRWNHRPGECSMQLIFWKRAVTLSFRTVGRMDCSQRPGTNVQVWEFLGPSVGQGVDDDDVHQPHLRRHDPFVADLPGRLERPVSYLRRAVRQVHVRRTPCKLSLANHLLLPTCKLYFYSTFFQIILKTGDVVKVHGLFDTHRSS